MKSEIQLDEMNEALKKINDPVLQIVLRSQSLRWSGQTEIIERLYQHFFGSYSVWGDVDQDNMSPEVARLIEDFANKVQENLPGLLVCVAGVDPYSEILSLTIVDSFHIAPLSISIQLLVQHRDTDFLAASIAYDLCARYTRFRFLNKSD